MNVDEKVERKEFQDKDYRGIVAAIIIVASFLLVGYSMYSNHVIPEVFLGALSSAWGAIVAWYFFKEKTGSG